MSTTREPTDTPHRERVPIRTILTLIGLVLATYLLLLMVVEVRRVLVWMVIAGFFAVALNPVVNGVQKVAPWCRRSLATLVVFLLVVLGLAGLIALFVVPLAQEGTTLAHQIPQLITDAKAGRGVIGDLLTRTHALEYLKNNEGKLKELAAGLGTPALAFVRGAATGVAGVITIFVLAYLMVLQAPTVVDGFVGLFPLDRRERVRKVGAECARTITGYLSGNLAISVVCGVLTYGVLKICGVPYSGLIALFVSIADLIPLIGATLGAVVAGGAAFGHSVKVGVIVVVFFVLYQQLENHLLQPLIFSRTVKVNPLTVLIAILIGVELAGILGALLAIPVAGVIQIVARDSWEHGPARRRRILSPEDADDADDAEPAPEPEPA